MPETKIVDAHVHLWDPTAVRIPWLDGNEVLNRPLGLPQYSEQTAGIDLAVLVYVQVDATPDDSLAEIRWLLEHARADPRVQGIVAWAPVEDGSRVRSYLDELVTISPLIKGVRRLLQGEPDPAFCLRPDFVSGVRLLPSYGLSFDLCITHVQLPHVVTLVRQCPDTQFILDHLGKPDIAAGLLEPWRTNLRDLAALPNVMCKISGAVTEAERAHWSPADLAPFIEHALAVFGEDRVVFGSDWPVVLLAASYREWVTALESLTAHLSPVARHKLWSANARRFYRLAGEEHRGNSATSASLPA